MREIPAVAKEQFGVFRGRQALDEGWTESALRHAVRTGELDQPRPSTYAVPVDPGDPDRFVVAATRRAIAAALTHRDAAVTHAPALRWQGLPIILRDPSSCVSVPHGARRDAVGAHLHRAHLDRRDLVVAGATMLTVPTRSIVDFAREAGTRAALVAADAAVNRGLITPADLAEEIARCAGIPWLGRARQLPTLVDGRSESPLETLSRWEIAAAGLPAPTLQQIILDEDGRFVARVDFYWDRWGVVGEADGEGKQQSVAALRAQSDRDRDLRELGLQLVRWGPKNLAPFAGVAGRVEAAFGRGIPPTGPRRWRLAKAI